MPKSQPAEVPECRLRCTDHEYCSVLLERVFSQEGSYKKGLLVGTLILRTSGAFFDLPVFYKGYEDEPPLFLNFCPFCGHDFALRLQRFDEAIKKSRADHAESGKPDFIPLSKKAKNPRRPAA